jgi:hypothetical protein
VDPEYLLREGSGVVVAIESKSTERRPARQRADKIKDFRCKNLIVVIEDPENPRNIGTVIRTSTHSAPRKSMWSILDASYPTIGRICGVSRSYQSCLCQP